MQRLPEPHTARLNMINACDVTGVLKEHYQSMTLGRLMQNGAEFAAWSVAAPHCSDNQ